MNARLKVVHQKSSVKTIKLQPTTTIGRTSECDLKISSSLVSRVHCRIIVTDQSVTIEDLGSANGTFVDGEPLTPNQPLHVNPGAKLVVGPAEFIVEYVTETANTVVIRRSSEGARPALEELRNALSTGDSGLLMSGARKQADEPKARPAAEAASPPRLDRPTPLIQKAASENAIPKVAKIPAAAPVAAAVVPSPVAVAAPIAPPVAKVVMAIPVETAPVTVARPLAAVQPQPVVASPPVAAAPPRVEPPVAAPPTENADLPMQFGTFEDTISASTEVTSFSFGGVVEESPTSSPAAASKGKKEKEKPLKSLFSVFGGKPKATKASSIAAESSQVETPVSAPAEPEPASASHEEQPAAPFGFGDVAAGGTPPEKHSGGGQADDDFQNFLNQF